MAPRPTLTRDAQGFVVLYVGRGKEASLSTQLFCPMLGEEIEVDHAQLAKELAKLVEEGLHRWLCLFLDTLSIEHVHMMDACLCRQNRWLGRRRMC